eukprot:1057608_1
MHQMQLLVHSAKKANIHLVNINRICFCGRKVTTNADDWRQCKSCCKVVEKNQKMYLYYCNAKQCRYRETTGYYFTVCSACYESTNNSNIDWTRSFLFCKMTSLVERIKK